MYLVDFEIEGYIISEGYWDATETFYDEWETSVFKLKKVKPKKLGMIRDPDQKQTVVLAIDQAIATEPPPEGTIMAFVGGYNELMPSWFVGTGIDYETGQVTGAYTGNIEVLSTAFEVTIFDSYPPEWALDHDWMITGDDMYSVPIGNVGIGITNPGAKLEVAGQVKITGGSPGTGKVLTSDDSGLASWQVSPTSVGIQGTGTPNRVAKFIGSVLMADDVSIGDSAIYEYGGKVGIGTTTPSQLLEIRGFNPRILVNATSSNPELNLRGPGKTEWAIYQEIFVSATGDLRFYQAGDKVTFQNGTGNVGIGTTSPSAPLDVSRENSGRNQVAGLFSNPSDTTGSQVSIDLNVGKSFPTAWRLTGTSSDLRIGNAVIGTPAITISGIGNVGIGTTNPGSYKLAVNGSAAKPGGGYWSVLSDNRVKKINDNFERGLSEVTMLRPVHYEYIDDKQLNLPTDREFIGVISQEVEEIIPEAVEQNEDGYFMINNEPIFWAMVNAIKELKEQNQLLKEKVEALEKKLQ